MSEPTMSQENTSQRNTTTGVGGLHHVTAIASRPQGNVDFYAGALGLRLVKKTVNFDDPGTYHLYYGDEIGRPGTLLTFFPWSMARRGTRGSGETTVVSLAVADGSLGRWIERLDRHEVEREAPRNRYGRPAMRLRDPDGMLLELVETAPSDAEGIVGVAGVAFTLRNLDPTSELLTGTLGMKWTEDGSDRRRFTAGPAGIFVDLVAAPLTEPGRMGAGTIHHVAWRADDEAHQRDLRGALVEGGLGVTPVQDRRYFESIYFREPGGVLFEIATDGPGFLRDESPEELGGKLRLPPWLEGRRGQIEGLLPELATSGVEGGTG
ncbi:MAG: ring-cleaving dioxygenase [Acidobacteriota bacterium]